MDIFGAVGNFVTSNASMIAGGAATTGALWVLKQIPNAQIKSRVHDFFKMIGTTRCSTSC